MVNLTSKIPEFNSSFNNTLDDPYIWPNSSNIGPGERELLPYFIAAVLVLIILIGITGNSLVIYTICSGKIKWTSTNILLLNLAMADILFLVLYVSFQAYWYVRYRWVFGDVMCKFAQYVIQVIFFVNVWSLVVVSVVRLVSVVFTNSAAKVWIKRNILLVIGMIWIICMCANIPCLIVHEIETVESNNITYCGIQTSAIYGLRISSFTFGYAIPLLIIIAMYVPIIHYLNRQSALQQNHDSALAQSQDRKKRVFKNVLVVVLVFAISWMPFHLHSFFYRNDNQYGSEGLREYDLFRVLSDCLAFSNSCVNPFIYNYMSQDFRAAFKQVMCECQQSNQGETIPLQQIPIPRAGSDSTGAGSDLTATGLDLTATGSYPTGTGPDPTGTSPDPMEADPDSNELTD